MKKIYFILTAMAVVLTSAVKAQTYKIATWNYQSINPAAEIASPASTTTKDNNLQYANIRRGGGMNAASINYGMNAGVTGGFQTTESQAISNGDFYLVDLKATNGTMSITKIGYRIYRNANGPQRFRWAYSINGSAFVSIGTEVYMTAANSDDFRTIDLTGITDIPNTSIVTFRLVGYDGVNQTTNKNFGLRSNNSNALEFEGSLSTTLPVNLTSFTAKLQANAVQLNWQTASEQNNSHFEVLRSQDGTNFTVIGQQAGNGTTNTTNSYSFTDHKPLVGTSYYALKQFDLDGNSKEYDAIPVKYILTNAVFTAVINSSSLTAKVDATNSEKATISVVDISGNEIASKSVVLEKGINQIELSNINLTTGKLYLVNLRSNNQNQTVKIIK